MKLHARIIILCLLTALVTSCGELEKLYVDTVTSSSVTVKWDEAKCAAYNAQHGVYYSTQPFELAEGNIREYSEEKPANPAFYKNANAFYIPNHVTNKAILRNLQPDTIYYVNVTLLCQKIVDTPVSAGCGSPTQYTRTLVWTEKPLTKGGIIRTMSQSPHNSGFHAKRITTTTVELAWDAPKPVNIAVPPEQEKNVVKYPNGEHFQYTLSYDGINVNVGNAASYMVDEDVESRRRYDFTLKACANGSCSIYDPLSVRTLRNDYINGAVQWYHLTDDGILTFRLMAPNGENIDPLSIIPTAYCSPEPVFRLRFLNREDGPSIVARVMNSHLSGNVVSVYDKGVCTIKLDGEIASEAADVDRLAMDREEPKVIIVD